MEALISTISDVFVTTVIMVVALYVVLKKEKNS